MANSREEEMELRRGPWTVEEDSLLINYIASHGEGRWNLLAKSSGLKRNGKSCRLRWLNYLKPDIKRGNLSPQEQLLILELHSKWGNRWSKIAQHLPGRTDNEIKNYWRTRVQKQARQLKIDSNSNKFLEAIKHFWMPRLLEKMEQNSPSSPSTSLSSVTSTSTIETQKNQNLLATTKPSRKSLDCYNEKSTSNLSKLPANSEHQTSPTNDHQTHVNIPFNNSAPEDCYIVDSHNFDMECYNEDMPGSIFTLDSQMVEGDWIGDELGGNSWDMDELWQFRK